MDVADVLILQASYTNPVHAEAIARVLNHYAEDPMGGGQSLDPHLLEQLPAELAKRAHAFSVLAFVGGEPAGLVNCFEGFSTFACRPLVNVHDVAVLSKFRGLGLSRKMLQKVEDIVAAASSPSKCSKAIRWPGPPTRSSGSAVPSSIRAMVR